jgi:(2Fe-2S) ferredoxin
VEISKPPQQKFFFVCENDRDTGPCCAPEGQQIRELLKSKVKSLGLGTSIRVSRSGCLDLCAKGPSVLLMPEGIWFGQVTEADIEVLIETACSDREAGTNPKGSIDPIKQE